jgi:hypothetical protein
LFQLCQILLEDLNDDYFESFTNPSTPSICKRNQIYNYAVIFLKSSAMFTVMKYLNYLFVQMTSLEDTWFVNFNHSELNDLIHCDLPTKKGELLISQ